jgi:hypothetical protein
MNYSRRRLEDLGLQVTTSIDKLPYRTNRYGVEYSTKKQQSTHSITVTAVGSRNSYEVTVRTTYVLLLVLDLCKGILGRR